MSAINISEEDIKTALEKYWKEVQQGSNPALIDLFDLRDFLIKELRK